MLQTIEIYSIWFDLIWFDLKGRPQSAIPGKSSRRQTTDFHPCSKQPKTEHQFPSLLQAVKDRPQTAIPTPSGRQMLGRAKLWHPDDQQVSIFLFFFTIYSHTDYRVMAISASWDRWRRVLRVPETPAIVETAWNRLTQKPITRSVSTTETIRTPTVTLSVSVSDVTFQSFSICWRTRSCTKQAQNKEVFRLV